MTQGWTFHQACGCSVKFFAASNGHAALRMLPCSKHSAREHEQTREDLIAQAKFEYSKRKELLHQS